MKVIKAQVKIRFTGMAGVLLKFPEGRGVSGLTKILNVEYAPGFPGIDAGFLEVVKRRCAAIAAEMYGTQKCEIEDCALSKLLDTTIRCERVEADQTFTTYVIVW